jgi:uncharacterized membrane protein YhfC
MFGAGHGGTEAFIVGLIAAVGAINLFVARNVDPAQLGLTGDKLAAAQAQVAAAFSVPVLYPLLGAYERVLALCTHLLLAVLVMRAFTHRNVLWLAGAILWHALTDAVAVFVAIPGGPVSLALNLQPMGAALVTEGAISVLAAIAVILIFVLREPEPLPAPVDVAPLPPAAPESLRPAPATSDQLDRTRYQ